MKSLKSVKSWYPMLFIKNGIIKTKKREYCKILEIVPVNFNLKSQKEQESILYLYKAFLKICEFDMQILVYSKRTDVQEYVSRLESVKKEEKSEKIKLLIDEYERALKKESESKINISRKFYIVVKSELKQATEEQIFLELNEKALKIRNALIACGNEVIDFGEDNNKILRILYEFINKKTSKLQTLEGEPAKWADI